MRVFGRKRTGEKQIHNGREERLEDEILEPELRKYETIRKKMDGEKPEWENNGSKIGF